MSGAARFPASKHSPRHAKGAIDALTLGDIATVIADVPAAIINAIMPWHIPILPQAQVADVGTANPFVSNTFIGGGGAYSNGGSSDEMGWDFMLAAGTWNLNTWLLKGTNCGIVVAYIDGVALGAGVDTYAAAGANIQASWTGFTVATTGKKRISFKAPTKNASSSAYFINLLVADLRRTA